MNRNKQDYEDAVNNLEDYVKNPKGVKLAWNTLQLAKDWSSTPDSLGRRAVAALEKHGRLGR